MSHSWRKTKISSNASFGSVIPNFLSSLLIDDVSTETTMRSAEIDPRSTASPSCGGGFNRPQERRQCTAEQPPLLRRIFVLSLHLVCKSSLSPPGSLLRDGNGGGCSDVAAVTPSHSLFSRSRSLISVSLLSSLWFTLSHGSGCVCVKGGRGGSGE